MSQYPKMLYRGAAFPDGEICTVAAADEKKPEYSPADEEAKLIAKGWRLLPAPAETKAAKK